MQTTACVALLQLEGGQETLSIMALSCSLYELSRAECQHCNVLFMCISEIASGSVFLEPANECVKSSASVQGTAQSTESKLPSPYHTGAVPWGGATTVGWGGVVV